MGAITPSWTDNVVVQAAYGIIKGELVRSTTGLDLRGKYGGRLFCAVGFGGSTDLSVPVDVLIRPTLNNDGTAHKYSANHVKLQTGIDPYTRLVNNVSNYAAGTSSFIYDGHAGKTAALGELQFFWGVTTIPTSSGAITPAGGCEVLRCSKGITTPLVTDSPSKYLHNDNEFIGLASAWTIWLPGGATYEIIFDYGGSSTGEAVAVMADIQTYDQNTTA